MGQEACDLAGRLLPSANYVSMNGDVSSMAVLVGASQELDAVLPVVISTLGDNLLNGPNDSTDVVLAKRLIVDEDNPCMMASVLDQGSCQRHQCLEVEGDQYALL